ncbi:hypothetical protein ABU558_26520, partial [Escherichia coli]
SIVGIYDLTRAGWTTVQRTPEGLLIFSLVGILYFLICFPLVKWMDYLEKRLQSSNALKSCPEKPAYARF